MHCFEPRMITNIFKNSFRNKYTSWLTYRFNSRRNIETIPKCISAIITDITNVNTDPHRHLRLVLVFTLHLYSTSHGIDIAGKYAQCAITEKLKDLAAIFFMHGQKDAAMSGPEL